MDYWKNTEVEGENSHLRFNEIIGEEAENDDVRAWGKTSDFTDNGLGWEFTDNLDYPNNQAKTKVRFDQSEESDR